MKKLALLSCLIIISIAAHSQPPAGNANPGDWYGQKVTLDNAVKLEAVAVKLFADTTSIKTKFTATVLDVCPKKGCWMKLAINDSTTAFVKMKDYSFFVPLATIGKTVVIDGELMVKTISVAELQHYAEDAKKSKEEIAAITNPQQEIRVMANGITVVK